MRLEDSNTWRLKNLEIMRIGGLKVRDLELGDFKILRLGDSEA